MRITLAAFFVVHGLIHLLGFAKAFGLAEVPQLSQHISRTFGLLWLGSAGAMALAAASLFLMPRSWWVVALAAAILSQGLIVASWSDARFGTIANLIILAAALFGFASQGPLSFRAEFRREVERRLDKMTLSRQLLVEEDLTSLPEPVRAYLRVSGAVGKPRVEFFSATWQGKIRGGPDEPWMTATAVQHNFIRDPARFFLMDARKGLLPADVYHSFVDGSARMRVRAASLVPILDSSGPELTRAETVTLFNDLCVLAPGALIDSRIRWEAVDSLTARGHFTVGGNTVAALLYFNDMGELVDFVSDDRLAASPDGRSFTPRRWSTPLGSYRQMGDRRVSTHGAGVWHPPEGPYPYVELDLIELRINGDL